MPKQQHSLDLIRNLREQKKQEADVSKARIQKLTNQLFAPQESKGKIDGWMKQLNTGIAAYDGIMTGFKLLRRLRYIFTRRR